MAGPNLLEDVANDLAIWIDQTATQVALAFAPARAPFSAQVTEEQKLEFYRTRLFNPDGTPNPQGRQAEMQRLGSEGFANVYKAVIKRYPELRVAPPPPIEVPSEWPQAAPAGPPVGPPGPPGAPPGPPAGLPPGPGGTGPMSGPPRPPMMPPPGVRPMARGGVVTRPTVALIGEAGPEAVVPLDQYQPPGSGDWTLGSPQEAQARPEVALPPNVSPWNDLIAQHAGDYANDPRFLRIAAAAARAESTDDPRAYQIGYDPNDPRTHTTYGGRGLWQFDIGPQGMGAGVPEQQLFDPKYQAGVIVPQFAQNYARLQQQAPGLSDQELAARVYGATERPAGTVAGRWISPQTDAYQNYLRAWNSLDPNAR